MSVILVNVHSISLFLIWSLVVEVMVVRNFQNGVLQRHNFDFIKNCVSWMLISHNVFRILTSGCLVKIHNGEKIQPAYRSVAKLSAQMYTQKRLKKEKTNAQINLFGIRAEHINESPPPPLQKTHPLQLQQTSSPICEAYLMC